MESPTHKLQDSELGQVPPTLTQQTSNDSQSPLDIIYDASNIDNAPAYLNQKPLSVPTHAKHTENTVPTSLNDVVGFNEGAQQFNTLDSSKHGTFHTLDAPSISEANKENYGNGSISDTIFSTVNNIENKTSSTNSPNKLTNTPPKEAIDANDNVIQEEKVEDSDKNENIEIVKENENKEPEEEAKAPVIENLEKETEKINDAEERKSSFRQNLRIEINKGNEKPDNILVIPRSDTERSEGMSQEIPEVSLSREGSVIKESRFKKMGSNANFSTDQQDSEGYSTNARTGESPKEGSALSSNEESKAREAERREAASKPKVSLQDFQKVTVIGRGSYGEVSLVKKISTGKLYALKAIDKYFMKKEKKEHQVYVEKEVLVKSNHPNIIKFYSSFQDKKKLYFVLEYVGGGEFSDYLRMQRKLNKEQIKFYTAEIINILEYLHSCNIAHRDIKPENLLLTTDGHLKCIDFGTARFLNLNKRSSEAFSLKNGDNKAEDKNADGEAQDDSGHRNTFVGTAQYVSPEMLERSECSAPADLWALGCMIYQMSEGRYPFEEHNEFLIFQKIQNLDVTYSEEMDPEIKDLVQKLLVKDAQARLGAGPKGSDNDYLALKMHPLFKGIRFGSLHKQPAPVMDVLSPYKMKKAKEANNFEEAVNRLAPNRKHFLSDDLQPMEHNIHSKTPSQFALIENSEKIELQGLVLKKCGWLFYRSRLLVLNNKPRLTYFDPETNQIKGEVPLEETTYAELESKTKWNIVTAKRKYYFKEMEHSAEKWVEAVNAMVAKVKLNKVN